MGSEGELAAAAGYKLVPWSSWDQWNFVRESIFSSDPASVAAALTRISAWRSRGCLPLAIDVTAAFVEIQQKDPFFREGISSDALSSEEMLAMLYCMAIMRLVNGFVEPAHKKTGCSISELAGAIGIPRMLVDIRHEGSHRDLPSLQLVRLASMKALDWLKSNYWEPQRNAIPDVRKEIRSRLCEMIYYLKTKHIQSVDSSQTKRRRAKQFALLRGCNKLSSQIGGNFHSSKSDGCGKHISKISKIISRLYSAYPSEVVSVLLEFIQLHTSDLPDNNNMEQSNGSSAGDPALFMSSMDDLKTIINRLSKKRPRLLLSILETVLEMIEVNDPMRYDKEGSSLLSSQYKADICRIKYLCSLVPWLLMNLKALKDSGQIRFLDETQALFTEKNAVPRVSLKKFLRKCLTVSILGDKHLSDSVLVLAEMIGDVSLTERLRKLPSLGLHDMDFTECSHVTNIESILAQEENSIYQAAEKLEFLRLRIRNRKVRSPAPPGESMNPMKKWNVAKLWIPCPIGMLPCSFSCTPVLPVLDKALDGTESKKIERFDHKVENDHNTKKREASSDIESIEDGSTIKRLKEAPEVQRWDSLYRGSPMEGQLLVDGIWKKVSEEELLAIESDISGFLSTK